MKIFENIQGYNASNIKRQVFVVKNFFERKSYIAVPAAFQQLFHQAPPYKKTIQQNITKYGSHGTSLNENIENSGRQRTT